MAYNWENMYNYDVTFRQLMEFNPSRSWAVTYNQMWNLSMTTPLMHNQNRRSSFGNNNNSFQGTNVTAGQKRKLVYCWSFDKGAKGKFGKKYKFIERCSYCDSPAHGVHACDKLKDKDNSGGTPAKKRKQH